MGTEDSTLVKQTPLADLHVNLGAKMVPFAGYSMPLQYPAGILTEHRHTRSRAGLFDVSHMGQLSLYGERPGASLERLVPGNISGLAEGEMRYTLLLNEQSGIVDDLIVTRITDSSLSMVVNAACKEGDVSHFERFLPECDIKLNENTALLALQGPEAAQVMAKLAPLSRSLVFMTGTRMAVSGIECYVSRSGYTGEDGFEISVPVESAINLAEILLSEEEVAPIGLGARDSLRLEAGLCLYGQDIDRTTTPLEAALMWVVARDRRGENEFLGAKALRKQMDIGPSRRRVGISPVGSAFPRPGTQIMSREGKTIGVVTSGGFGATVGKPIAMGYVSSEAAGIGEKVGVSIRGRTYPAQIVSMPFVSTRYFRGI